MVTIETKELSDVLGPDFYKVKDLLNNNDVIVVPDSGKGGKPVISIESVRLLKRMKNQVPKSLILDKDSVEFKDFRSIDFELPRFIVENPLVLSIIGTLIGDTLFEIAKAFLERRKKDPKNPLIKEPVVKVKVYQTKTKKYYEFEGPASKIGKEIIESLK